MSPSEGAPEEFDQTVFSVRNDRTIGIEGLAQNLVKAQHRYYLTPCILFFEANNCFYFLGMEKLCNFRIINT